MRLRRFYGNVVEPIMLFKLYEWNKKITHFSFVSHFWWFALWYWTLMISWENYRFCTVLDRLSHQFINFALQHFYFPKKSKLMCKFENCDINNNLWYFFTWLLWLVNFNYKKIMVMNRGDKRWVMKVGWWTVRWWKGDLRYYIIHLHSEEILQKLVNIEYAFEFWAVSV